MNVLISSAGRRGALLQLVRNAIAPTGGKVFAVDMQEWSAACRLADGWIRVPRCTQPDFADSVFDYCDRNEIRLIIPTIDPELLIYAKHRSWFASHGIKVAVSGFDTVHISSDKLATYRFLRNSGLPTVETLVGEAATSSMPLEYPVIVKPRFGNSSANVYVAEDRTSLDFYLDRTPQPIVQQLAKGDEYTVNFFVGREGVCLAAVPHWRAETRGGEVSKCVTVKHRELMDLATELSAKLPDAWGPMCFQAFVDKANEVRIIEINSRFGGGYPIAHRAGADFISWLVNDARGRPLPKPSDQWIEGVVMTRWETAVFTTAEDVGLCA